MKLKPFFAILFLITFLINDLFGGGVHEISKFSSFENEALQKLKTGEILAAKGKLMDFERGISAETCFLAPFPLEKVLDHIAFWDQTPYADLGVFIQGKINKEGPPDFSKLCFIPSLRPVSKFFDKNKETRLHESPLHLSSAEALKVSQIRETLDAHRMNQLWSNILSRRLTDYQSGGLNALPMYDATPSRVSAGQEVDSILAELPTVSVQFAELFHQIKSMPNDGEHYWQMEDVDGTAVLVLGTIYSKRLSNGGVQVIDLQWYVTSGYYTAFTCYELHPLEIGKTSATLIWRGDYTSISMKQLRKGVERMFSVNIMVQEIKKSIRCFLDDLGKR